MVIQDLLAAWLQTDAGKAETQRISDIASLKSQVLSQWKQLGVSSLGGGIPLEERAQGLAERLYANKITDLTKIGYGSKQVPVEIRHEAYMNYPRGFEEPGVLSKLVNVNGENQYVPLSAEELKTLGPGQEQGGYSYVAGYDKPRTESWLTYDGRNIGFLGDIGTAENWQPTGYLQPGNLASWGAQGKGAVSYTVQQAPNGQVYFIPSWGSTSDLGSIAPVLGIGLGLLAPGIGSAIGSALAPAASAAVQSAIGSAIIGGTMAEATGGDFLKGAALSGIGSLAGGIQPGLSEALGGGTVGNIASNVLIGGTMAELSGGDFAQGALLSGISSGIDEAKLATRQGAFENAMTESGLAGQTSVTQADWDALNAPYVPTTDFNVTPDYSLATGASGAPGLILKPIDTEYQVGSFNYTLGDLIEGLGLQMPSTPNLESMDGGQGIVLKTKGGYITEQGFIPDSYIASLGDPESFINKPVVDVDLSLEELQQATPEDISKKLSLLDIAKALTPAALAALTKKVVDTAKSEATSGFQIVPIPSTWKSPEYDMAFAPSAPIDFGTPTLLRGTQWETPISLSGLINTLNQPVIAPQTQQMMTQFQAPEMPYETGITDIIGEIGGQPVSIADIISGIQSGQNYSS